MEFTSKIKNRITFFLFLIYVSTPLLSQVNDNKTLHRIGIEARPGYLFPTTSFYSGENDKMRTITDAHSIHLNYSFQPAPYSLSARIYGGAYQGIGISAFTFGNSRELGDPIAIYLFQGGRIAQITPRFSLNYEWNFGFSFGWHPYDYNTNYYNKAIGSRINAYINAGIHFNWATSSLVDIIAGVDFTHFSNGNTKFPNAGLNSVAFKFGVVYHINRRQSDFVKPLYLLPIPRFPRHISYDLALFGSWRRKGVYVGDGQVASPKAYTVLGFNFAPMYNFGYKFRAGISFDGVYDGSANVYTEDYAVGSAEEFISPSKQKQLALGISGRAEYVMPYFRINMGLGANVLHGGGDLKVFYQILALKTELTRSSFLHIGYCLHNFKTPSYLMLGVGYRFGNKYPKIRR